MLLKTSLLNNMPVMSLQVGSEIATTSRCLISPTNLKIIGFELTGKNLVTRPSFLRTEDIRELSNIGFIIDSDEECVGIDDVLLIKEIYELDFSLNGMQVLDKSGQKLGKIYDNVFATETFTIEQLCIKRPFLKSFSDAELLIHRNQIIEINRDSVIVRNQTESSDINKSHTVLQNPFRSRRQNSPQTGTINPSMK